MNFTKTPPNTPGFYAWRIGPKDNKTSVREVFSPVDGVFIDRLTDWMTQDVGGEWCRLVPSEEVEKAYVEGFRFSGYGMQHYDYSRAKRVAEGMV